MKTQEEIKVARNLQVLEFTVDGGSGIIWKLGKRFATVIWSFTCGWDHVSVCPFKPSYVPTWQDMCELKDMFFNEEETVVQYHPAKSQYVNMLPNCLHLWKPTGEALPTPPSIMVGIRDGQTPQEAREEADALMGGNTDGR